VSLLAVQLTGGSAWADDYSWVGNLPQPDAPTKQRLAICAISATANYAALRHLSFDFDLGHEVFLRDPAGAMSLMPGKYHGTVRWRDGAVRYDIIADKPSAPTEPAPKEGAMPGENPHPLVSKLGVIRTKEMVAYTEIHPYYDVFLTVDFPPPSSDEWKFRRPGRFTILDPWIHYASNFRGVEPSLREFWEKCRIESEESDGVIHLSFFRTDSPGRVDIYCDRAVDYLPVRTLAGEMRGKEYSVFVQISVQWQRVSEIWYPLRFEQTAYMGTDRRPRKEWDLAIRNLRVGSTADAPASAFTVDTLEIPERYGGIDHRTPLPKQLIKLHGRVRERRQGDPPAPTTGFQRRMDQELARATQEAVVVLRQRAYGRAAFWGSSIVAGIGLLLLGRRVYRRAGGFSREPSVQRPGSVSRGMTLIEVLVVVAIIGLLIALLLPAVQSAREAGRRAVCASNLRQIGVALAEYECQWQRFPPLVVIGPPSWPLQEYSAFVRILPMLEQNPLYQSVNLDIPLQASVSLAVSDANYTASLTRLGVLLCPSDAQRASAAPANYRLCEGRGPHWEGSGLYGNDDAAPFFNWARSTAEFTDGLSFTALLSERCVGGGVEGYVDLWRDILPGDPRVSLGVGQPYSVVCQASESWAAALIHPFPWSGWTWMAESLTLNGYTHAMMPNSPVTDCGDNTAWGASGAVTARSFHPGGVQLLAGDGGVRFVKNGIDGGVWRALSTINAGDGPSDY